MTDGDRSGRVYDHDLALLRLLRLLLLLLRLLLLTTRVGLLCIRRVVRILISRRLAVLLVDCTVTLQCETIGKANLAYVTPKNTKMFMYAKTELRFDNRIFGR